MKKEQVIERFKKLLDDTRFEDDRDTLAEVLFLAFNDDLFAKKKEE